MLEFLLGHKGVDITGISPSSAPVDNKRTFVDPDNYLPLKPLPNNSTLNSTQAGTPSSKGTGSDSYYVNSPGTGSTVVAAAGVGAPFNPALSLNLPHSSFNNSLGRAVPKRQKSTPNSGSASMDPAAETLLPQATPGAQSGNFFNYEHIPDQRVIQRLDSHEATNISSPLSGIPDYRTVVLGSEPPRVYNPSEYYNAPSVKSPFVSSATPYCNTSAAIPLQSPHYTHLSNVDTRLTNRPSPVSVEHSQTNMNRLSNSNYSPALESTPATPLVMQKNANGLPYYPTGNSPPNALNLNNNYQSVKNTSSFV